MTSPINRNPEGADKLSEKLSDLEALMHKLQEDPARGRSAVLKLGRKTATGPTGVNVIFRRDGNYDVGDLKPIKVEKEELSSKTKP